MTMKKSRFEGRVVLVTGGTQGIGAVIAETFIAEGAQVVSCARHAPAAPALTNRWTHLVADVRDENAVQRLFTDIKARFGRLDVLVNNAGGSPHVDAATASLRLSRAVIELNLIAPLWLSQKANELMQQQQDGGVIVHITSVSGTRASPGTAAYGAAKAGLLNLAKSQAVEWAPKVRVNCVTAGLIRTEKSLTHYGDEACMARVAATVPLGRMGTPKDVAHACMFLASEEASYISGTDLLVDGGSQWPAFLVAAQANNPGEQ